MQSLDRVTPARRLLFDMSRMCPMIIEHMSARPTPAADVVAGTAFALLVGLAAASRKPRDEQPENLRAALDAVGDSQGESWLNLLGVGLDRGAPYTAERLAKTLRTLDGVEI